MKKKAIHIQKFNTMLWFFLFDTEDKTFCGRQLSDVWVEPEWLISKSKLEDQATCRTCIALMKTGKPA